MLTEFCLNCSVPYAEYIQQVKLWLEMQKKEAPPMTQHMRYFHGQLEKVKWIKNERKMKYEKGKLSLSVQCI